MQKLPYTFYKDIEGTNNILYTDTDSMFLYVCDNEALEKMGLKLVPDKEKIDEITEKIVQPLSKKINNAIVEYWNKYILPKQNVSSKHNIVDFKTEMILDSIVFTGVKKRYVCRLFKEKKTYFIPPKMIYKGIEIKRTDTARITRDLYKDLFDIIFNNNITKLRELLQKCINDYIKKFKNAIDNMDYDYIGIPSNWSFTEYKEEPSYVLGARLYNTIINNECRPGVKGIRICLKVTEQLKTYVSKILKQKTNIENEYYINIKQLPKVTYFFLPPNYNKQKIKELIKKKILLFDWKEHRKIVIDNKLDVFRELLKSIENKKEEVK